MHVLFIGGRFEERCYPEVIQKTKTLVDDAGNTFQCRLINGLQTQDLQLTELSAPLIGPWPNTYRDVFFRGFEAVANEGEREIHYVHFNNIWGYRNLSRARALKREVDKFLRQSDDQEKMIIVYLPHTPYLEAAVYAQKKDPSIHIHMVVTDLPQFMNHNHKQALLYRFFKKIDLWHFSRLNAYVNSYMLLTEPMAGMLKVGKRPFIVVEGVADEVKKAPVKSERGKTIAYAGRLYEAYGVRKLLEAFAQISDPEARLILCGGGELREYVLEQCRKDSRILYHGIVPADKSREILQEADVLVNPRENDEEYTKYSFPSKNIEYLLTGNAVVAYMLDGVPKIYETFFEVPKDDSVEALRDAIERAIRLSGEELEARQERICDYLQKNCKEQVVAQRILALAHRP